MMQSLTLEINKQNFQQLKSLSSSLSPANNDNNDGDDDDNYMSFPSAGPALRTSDMAIDGSPLAKCGLSRPPETAIPKPYPGTLDRVT